MANHKSALKRAKQSETRRMRNKAAKTHVKTVVKQLQAAMESDSSDNLRELLVNAQATLDMAAKKGVMHKNTAARKVSRLTQRINTLSA